MDPKELNKKILGPKSYPVIVDTIVEHIRDAQANTLAGSELLKKTYQNLSESETPMMEVKAFITGAEEVAVDDAELKTVLDFCKKAATTADLNCLINVCKEEHLLNLKKAGHPNPEDTIKELESEFNQPSSIIEQGIKNGVFDKLNSKLLNDIKAGIGIDVNKELKFNLNESYQSDFGGVCKYTPIGIVAETLDNKTVLLMESDILSYDESTETYSKLNESEVLPLIGSDYKRLMEAVSSCQYNPETKSFSLCESWDFDLELKDGVCKVGRDGKLTEISSKALGNLLLESINAYESGKVLLNEGVQFDKQRYLKDADNIILLMENNKNIVEFDDLTVLRNLNESSYCMFSNNETHMSVPEILSVNGKEQLHCESFGNLCETVKDVLNLDNTGFRVQKLFESQLTNETKLFEERNTKITKLLEEQTELNAGITKIRELKKLAEDNSPAMDKLNEQENKINQMLESNLSELNFYKNEFSVN